MSYTPEFDECDCDCHRSPHVHHVMACCYQCPICRKNIRTFMFDEHVEQCKKRDDELGKLIDTIEGDGC